MRAWTLFSWTVTPGAHMSMSSSPLPPLIAQKLSGNRLPGMVPQHAVQKTLSASGTQGPILCLLPWRHLGGQDNVLSLCSVPWPQRSQMKGRQLWGMLGNRCLQPCRWRVLSCS